MINYISEKQEHEHEQEIDENNEDNILEEDEYEHDFPMPQNYKKYNIDGVPKRRKSSVNP